MHAKPRPLNVTPARPNGRLLPPLRHGDRLTREEFERRCANTPQLRKVERLNGMVYLAHERAYRRIDPTIPPLENGDRLSRAEFERRWENMPGLKKAELLNGEVFMPPPVSAEHHGLPHSDLMFWLGLFRAATPGVVVADNSTLRLTPKEDDDAQPDAMMFALPSHGGSAWFDENGYVEGVPELVAEVAASSVSYDLNTKLDVYLRNGIREYLVWRVHDTAVDWFVLRGKEYERLPPGPDGVLRSQILPGLWLDPAALIRGDMAEVMRVAQLGIASPEHAAFVERLRQAAANNAAGS